MYGGVSLAIYIHGVVQEMFRLVRATATRDNAMHLQDAALDGVEKVYRDLGRAVGRGPGSTRDDVTEADPVRTKFVIDILSGTSAGGINSLFLAKALANDQSLEELKSLWLEKADIHTLINDSATWRESDIDSEGMRQQPPKSLLASKRMLRLLQGAFGGMGKAAARSPYVDELDLFLTTTDIAGLPIELSLSDQVVWERRHKNVYKLRYNHTAAGPVENDFGDDNAEFHAFIARCTSSFPFAFEPARALDVTLGDDTLKRFFPDYSDMNPDVLRARPFGDGGYLDNKPFSHAIESMANRRPARPSQRKLVYIEPAPEAVPTDGQVAETPDAVENVLAALSLARYETIREDLHTVTKRNRTIERVGSILEGLEDDSFHAQLSGQAPNSVTDAIRPVGALVREYGRAYGGYHRLRVAALTDRIARWFAATSGIDQRSDLHHAIREVVRVWRMDNFDPEGRLSYDELRDAMDAGPVWSRGTDKQRYPQSAFLFLLDLESRVRRLEFVLLKLDALRPLNETSQRTLGRLRTLKPDEDDRRLVRRLRAALDDPDGQHDVRALAAKILDANEPAAEATGRLHLHPPLRFLFSDTSVRQAMLADSPQLEKSVAGMEAQLRALFETAESWTTDPIDQQFLADLEFVVSAVSLEDDSDEEELAHAIRRVLGEARMRETLLVLRAGDAESRCAFDAKIHEVRNALHEEYLKIKAAYRGLFRRDEHNPLLSTLDGVDWNKARDGLMGVLEPTTKPREDQAKQVLAAHRETLNRFASALWKHVKEVTTDASDRIRDEILNKRGRSPSRPTDGHEEAARVIALRAAHHYYSHFPHYDTILYPVFVTTELGADIAPVDVFRISPVDAHAISGKGTSRRIARKLAGTKLMNFGAFLDRKWRWNDMLWGRLDGAERLISATLPPDAPEGLRDSLIERAHAAILDEEVGAHVGEYIGKVISKSVSAPEGQAAAAKRLVKLVEALARSGPGLETESAIARLLQHLPEGAIRDLFGKQLREATGSTEKRSVRAYFTDSYQPDTETDPDRTVRALARSTTVTGHMLEDVATRSNASKQSLAWISRVGRMGVALAEVAVPRSASGLLYRHWLKLAGMLAAFMIVAGGILGKSEVESFGWAVGAAVLSVVLVTLTLRSRMRNQPWIGRLLAILVGLPVALVALTGIGVLYEHGVTEVVASGWKALKDWVSSVLP